MGELVSVIVPVYNVENELLDKCIFSIINQTYKNLEIILIDDGSVKDCADECDRLALMDSRIVVRHQENKGISGATNEGINIAVGNYIGFVDCDDYLDNTMFEVLYHNLIENNVDISMVGYKTLYPDGSVKLRTYYESDVMLSRDEAMRELIIDKNITSAVWNKLFRKELWNNIRFVEGMWFEDCEIMHRLFYSAYNGIYCSKERLYNYYQRSDSVMNCRQLLKVKREIEAWQCRLDFVQNNMPELSVKVKEKILKLAIKGLLNPNFHNGMSKEEYVKNSEKMVTILLGSDTECIIEKMPKYINDYRFLLKYKFSSNAKKVYMLKKRVVG